MGAFYGTVFIRSDADNELREVIDDLANRNRMFLLAPPINGWQAVYPSDHGQDDRIPKAIAKKIVAPILYTAIHDDDVFFYSYYRDGKLIDRFSSCPDYFAPVSKRMKKLLHGRPERLAEILPRNQEIEALEDVLEEMRDGPVFASQAFERFARIVGIPNASTSYEYLMAGETDGIDRWDEFIHIPTLNEQRKHDQEAAAIQERQKEKLKEADKLLAEVKLGNSLGNVEHHVLWSGDAMHGVLMSTSPNSPQGEVPVKQLAPPWNGSLSATGIVLRSQATSLATSPKGNYLGVCLAGQDPMVELWKIQDQTLELAIGHSAPVLSLAFTSDEKHSFSLSWNELICTEISTRQQIGKWQVNEGLQIDLHPDGNLVAIRKQNSAALFDLEAGEERSIRLGKYQDLSGLRQMLQAEITKQADALGPNWIGDQIRKTLKQLDLPAESPAGQRIQKESEEKANDILSGKAFEHMTERSFCPENFFRLIFADDGELLCCGSSAGIRVFKTSDVVASNVEEIAPLHFIQPDEAVFETGSLRSHFYGLVYDAQRGRVIYGGMGGTIHSLDLQTGARNDLVEIPGNPAITEMRLADGLLFCMCQPGFPEMRPKTKPASIQVWKLDSL